jgi:putative endonuclease
MLKKGFGYMYILRCVDGSYYTGSTIDLIRRLNQHNTGEGANHTANRLPVVLVYVEVYVETKRAFWREKQIQGWSRAKKEALIENKRQLLPKLARRKKNVK